MLADPADDGPRAVYADALLERGDPRGELITLQLARARGAATPAMRARERVLLDRHGLDQLGPLVAVVGRYELARGFLAACTVPRHRPRDQVDRLAGHPWWATVESFGGPPALYLDPAMRSLRALSIPIDEFDVLAPAPLAQQLAALEVTGGRRVSWPPAPARWLPWSQLTPARWPRLRELGLDSMTEPDDLRQLAALPLARQLDRRLHGGGSRLRPLVEWLEMFELMRPARDLVLEQAPWEPGRIAFAFDGARFHLDLSVSVTQVSSEQLVHELTPLAPRAASITVVARPMPDATHAAEPDYAAVRDLVVAHGGSFTAA